MAGGWKLEQRHGKSRVRVARVWRNADGEDVFVEWKVGVSLLSNCLPAYTDGDNSAIVATDTMKNTVYVKAKENPKVISMEEFAILLGEHFTSFYPQAYLNFFPFSIDSKLFGRELSIWFHKPTVQVRLLSVIAFFFEGFKLGSERHTTEVTVKKHGSLEIISGIEGLALLKTTKSGFEGFVRDQYTALPETNERMLATEVTALWRFPHIASIQLRMPNIHFLPVNLASKENGTIVKVCSSLTS
ncbi:hypothetical protein Taro_044813 [Colocasia esculenta]|uniref:Uricase n=1 Tax=Colocasia esculenta TaxID=4460 RepID=A0A843X3V0_COLES|nr:hypothetical protein [Colocasia esculenta]